MFEPVYQNYCGMRVMSFVNVVVYRLKVACQISVVTNIYDWRKREIVIGKNTNCYCDQAISHQFGAVQ